MITPSPPQRRQGLTLTNWPNTERRFARLQRGDPHGLVGPGEHVLEREGQTHAQLRTLLACGAAAASAPTEHFAESAEAAEVPHEDFERVAEVEAARGPTASQPLLSVTVVQLTLLGVAQHLVRLRDLLEALLGVGRAFVLIRVMLERELPVRLLDLLGVRVAGHAQKLVVVGHAGVTPRT
jgi:hypothetical protein